MPIIGVPKPLRDRLGDEATTALVDLINQADERAEQDVIVRSRGVPLSFSRWQVARHPGTFHELKTSMTDIRIEMVNLRTDLKIEMANFRADVIRWMFIFWIGQFGAIMGLLFAFFRR